MRTHGERGETGIPHQLIAIHGDDHGRGLEALPGTLAQRDDAEECQADESEPQCAENIWEKSRSREGKKSKNDIWFAIIFCVCILAKAHKNLLRVNARQEFWPSWVREREREGT